MYKVPTVVVRVTSGGILEAVCADVEVRVVLADYGACNNTGTGERTVTAPDGDPATLWARRLRPDLSLTAEYVRAADLPDTAWPMSIMDQL